MDVVKVIIWSWSFFALRKVAVQQKKISEKFSTQSLQATLNNHMTIKKDETLKAANCLCKSILIVMNQIHRLPVRKEVNLRTDGWVKNSNDVKLSYLKLISWNMQNQQSEYLSICRNVEQLSFSLVQRSKLTLWRWCSCICCYSTWWRTFLISD